MPSAQTYDVADMGVVLKKDDLSAYRDRQKIVLHQRLVAKSAADLYDTSELSKQMKLMLAHPSTVKDEQMRDFFQQRDEWIANIQDAKLRVACFELVNRKLLALHAVRHPSPPPSPPSIQQSDRLVVFA